MANDRRWAAVVPELACSDFAASLTFYIDVVGFSVRYSRPGFAYLDLGPAQLMIETEAGCWSTGERQRPYGRGINLQIEVADVLALRARIVAAGVGLFRDVAESWYRADAIERGQREFLVQDPDGYLLRFAQDIGTRAPE
nr:VOC family protein [Polymorphobacter sp.]